MYYSYVEMEYLPTKSTSFSLARTDLAVKLLNNLLTFPAMWHTHLDQGIVRKVFQEAFPFTEPKGGQGYLQGIYLSADECSTQP